MYIIMYKVMLYALHYHVNDNNIYPLDSYIFLFSTYQV